MKQTLAAAAAFAALALASPAAAASVRPCDGVTEAAFNIVEPWEANSRTFYQGRVRVASLDTGGEPACCSAHLLIVFYASDDPESFTCRLISDRDRTGFAGIEFSTIRSSYDPRRGLLLTFGYSVMPSDGGPKPRRAVLKVRVNVPAGAVTVES